MHHPNGFASWLDESGNWKCRPVFVYIHAPTSQLMWKPCDNVEQKGFDRPLQIWLNVPINGLEFRNDFPIGYLVHNI